MADSLEEQYRVLNARIVALDLRMQQLETELRERSVHTQNCKIAGSSLGIGGSVLIIVGFGLAFVTFGTSLIISGVGAGLAVTGAVTGGVAGLTHWGLFKKEMSEIELALQERKASILRLLGNLNRLDRFGLTDISSLTLNGNVEKTCCELRKSLGSLMFDPINLVDPGLDFQTVLDFNMPNLHPHNNPGNTQAGQDLERGLLLARGGVEALPVAVTAIRSTKIIADISKAATSSLPFWSVASTSSRVVAVLAVPAALVGLGFDIYTIVENAKKRKLGESLAAETVAAIRAQTMHNW